MNNQYSKIANWLTTKENHKNQSDFENNLILKRFGFEFCDFFLDLFYIAFYKLNIIALRQSLVSLFIVD
jgi:hypothetical protein